MYRRHPLPFAHVKHVNMHLGALYLSAYVGSLVRVVALVCHALSVSPFCRSALPSLSLWPADCLPVLFCYLSECIACMCI